MLHRTGKLPIDKELFLSIISGSQAGIATTAAIIIGLTIGTDDRQIVIISALVSIFVQAFNSSLTTIIAIHTSDEIDHNRDMNSLLRPLTKAGMQFLTHMVAGFIVLLPMIYVTTLEIALLATIAVAIVLLLWIGLFVGRVVRHSPLRDGVQSLVLGMMIMIGGFIAGFIIH